MCWSGEASAALATAGFLSTGYAAYKKESRMLWLPLGYFSLMELINVDNFNPDVAMYVHDQWVEWDKDRALDECIQRF